MAHQPWPVRARPAVRSGQAHPLALADLDMILNDRSGDLANGLNGVDVPYSSTRPSHGFNGALPASPVTFSSWPLFKFASASRG